MIQRNLEIGRWRVEFYFAPDGYDIDAVLDRMFNFGAGAGTMRRALELMESGNMNQGFTFCNPYEMVAIVMIGPTTDGKQFQNTFVHELRHLINGIASSLGIDLQGEPASYMTGDTAVELADIVCRLGCKHCHGGKPI